MAPTKTIPINAYSLVVAPDGDIIVNTAVWVTAELFQFKMVVGVDLQPVPSGVRNQASSLCTVCTVLRPLSLSVRVNLNTAVHYLLSGGRVELVEF